MSQLESNLWDIADLDRKLLIDFSAGKTQHVSNNSGGIDVKINWAGIPKYYVNMFDKLQKRICKLFVETTILSLFYRYCVGRSLSELGKLVPSPYSRRRSVILIEMTIFLLLILDVMRMSMSTVSFLVEVDSEILRL